MKKDKVIFWTATGLASIGMLMSGVLYLSHNPGLTDIFKTIGYPQYFMNILGTAKLLGAIALIQPKYLKLREWAYAGFTFTMIGAIWTHIASNVPGAVNPAVFLLILAVSYFFNNKIQRAIGK